ncbi:FAD-dependent oxidoreductase [Lusitaniella coriacea LEGE 07157]|uniref:FAD-dependent oxidoreductase n=1 Tax=Lusitaniella coriacea LEGE 07157 TaxID=945747 RepID=A0A8J7DLG4_9CYAN|nr:FAD-dependent oxidoreductase [Lusitaniella coriacea LEGE 07157]
MGKRRFVGNFNTRLPCRGIGLLFGGRRYFQSSNKFHSGLRERCARSPKSAGADVIVLKAKSYVGGRIQTNRTLGDAFEIGAGWIHGPQIVLTIAPLYYFLINRDRIVCFHTNRAD